MCADQEMKINQARLEAEMDSQYEVMVKMEAGQENIKALMEACLENTEH
jgi:hypothetical protein